MYTEKLQLSDIRYNPEFSGFEARVRIYDEGEVYDYPVHTAAPLQADFARVARLLVEKAHHSHETANPPLRLRRVRISDQSARQFDRTLPETSPMLQMLSALAA